MPEGAVRFLWRPALETSTLRSWLKLAAADIAARCGDFVLRRTRGVGSRRNRDGELQRTLEILRDSEQRYRALFESLDVGFGIIEVVFDVNHRPQDFHFLEVNPAFERQTGWRDVVGRRMREIAPDAEQYWFDVYGKVAETGEPIRFERRARALDRWYDVYAFPLAEASCRVGVLFRDITQRKQTERALRASEARSRLALDVAQLGTWSWRGAGNQLSADARFLDLCGFGPDDPLSIEDLMAHVHADDRAAVDARVREAVAPSGEGRLGAEFRCVGPDGGVRWLVARGMTEFSTAGAERLPARMQGTLMDVTARKLIEQELLRGRDELELRVRERTDALARANAALHIEIAERKVAEDKIRQLLGQLVDAQEDERRRLSRELHDTLGQHLAVLTLGLEAVRAQEGCPPRVMERLNYIAQAARRLEEEVDRLSYELRPLALDNMGLVDALRQYAGEWSAECGVPVDVTVLGIPADEYLPAAVETTVYRVVQEALTNVRKHAAASRVSLIAERRGLDLRVIVEDDGCGFDTTLMASPTDNLRRLGLRGMAERAALVAGSLDIESTHGHGTTVYLTVPRDVGRSHDETPQHEQISHSAG